MPDLPTSSSFIPKRTEGTRIRQKRTRNFFLLSIVSYACLVAAPTASAAVYVYQLYTNREFDRVVNELDEAIGSFSDAEMARVLEFDKRLELARQLVENHVSIVKVLDSLERTTAADVGFTALALERSGDGSIQVNADILATNFDTALFQRGAYKNTNVAIDNAALKDITFVPPSEVGEGERVMMTGTFGFSVSDIRFAVADTYTPSAGSVNAAEPTPAESSSGDEFDESFIEDETTEVTPPVL